MTNRVLARDLMKGPVRPLTTITPVREAAAFLVRHAISGAPVLNEQGRWIGVFTQNDLARYVQLRTQPLQTARTLESREAVADAAIGMPGPFGDAPVRDLMTMGLFTVFPEATLKEVIHTLTAFKVHRVFVIEGSGTALLGVITSMDVLQWMDAHSERSSPRRGRKVEKA